MTALRLCECSAPVAAVVTDAAGCGVGWWLIDGRDTAGMIRAAMGAGGVWLAFQCSSCGESQRYGRLAIAPGRRRQPARRRPPGGAPWR